MTRARSSKLSDFAPLAMEGVSLFALQKGKPECSCRIRRRGCRSHRSGMTFEFRRHGGADGMSRPDDLRRHQRRSSRRRWAGRCGRCSPRGQICAWMLDREDSPWYPTMKLFRQREMGNWTEVMHGVSANLREIAKL